MSRAPPPFRRAALLVLCVVAESRPAFVAAQPVAAPAAIIQTRRTSLKNMGKAMKSLVDELKSDVPDRVGMLAAAQVIAAGAAQLPRWFPAGSGAESGVETDALPYIWQNRAKFDSIAAQLAPESDKLLTVLAGADLAAIRAQAKALGEVCSSCHKSFRAD